jgi:glycosyltransferase involved in cell wall biosynthesis
MTRRRLYLHPMRWTSLGLSLLEAMQLGMPVVALACTEASVAVPPEAGVVSTSVARLHRAVAELVADPDRASEMGRAARKAALAEYGLPAFLRRWDDVLGRLR